MNSNKILQYAFWLVSAWLIMHISSVYIPYTIEQISIERSTLKELITSVDRCVMWVSGSDCVSVSMLPETAVAELSWCSDDESVAAVSDDGVITATGAGTAAVTVSGDNGVSTQVTVIVLDKVLPPDSDYPQNYTDIPLIANVDNSIGKYVPELVTVPDSYPANRKGMQMTPETFSAYKKMYEDCYAATGVHFSLLSAYRSYEYQQTLFDNGVRERMAQGYSREAAVERTALGTQWPGCSEHQLGESVDIGQLENSFANSKAGVWVTEHAHDYGFILRYPADKVDITKIMYEAWHFRYVGVGHAEYIYHHGLCLEEYIELQRKAAAAADEYCRNVSAQEYYDAYIGEKNTEADASVK